jgi:hypothetical protein
VGISPAVPTSPYGLPLERTRADGSPDAFADVAVPPPVVTAATTERARPRWAGAGAVAAIVPVLLAGAIPLVLHGVWHGTETDWFFAVLLWLLFLAPLSVAVAISAVTHTGGRRNAITLVLYLLAPPLLTVAAPIYFIKSWDRSDHAVRLFVADTSSEWALAFAVSIGLLAHAWMKRQGIISRLTAISLVIPAVAFVLFLKWRPVTLLGGANSVALEATSDGSYWRTLTICVIAVPVCVIVAALVARALRARLGPPG